MKLEHDTLIVSPCGGSGGVSIIDEALDRWLVASVTGVHDDGGHSGRTRRRIGINQNGVRSKLGLLPPGDASHQIAAHIRNPKGRYLFTYRWENGQRTGNDLISVAERIEGSHSAGIKAVEDQFKYYKGRVIPISDDDTHLKITLSDGTIRNGESKIDDLKCGDPSIVSLEFKPRPPKPNPEALEYIANADLILLPPGTLWGTHLPILKTPGVKEAIATTKAPIVCYLNAVTTGETDGYKVSDFASRLVEAMGREIDYAFVDVTDRNLPPNYIEAGSAVVENDLEENNPYIKKLYSLPLTQVEYIEKKFVIRHSGKECCDALEAALEGRIKPWQHIPLKSPRVKTLVQPATFSA
jgi:uncharacterized cofD-like protein